jgi:hypothetical protein
LSFFRLGFFLAMAIVGSCCVSSLYLSHHALAPRLSPASPCCQLNCILLRSITRGRLGQATSFHRLTSAWKKKGAHGRCERELLHRWRSPLIACQVFPLPSLRCGKRNLLPQTLERKNLIDVNVVKPFLASDDIQNQCLELFETTTHVES